VINGDNKKEILVDLLQRNPEKQSKTLGITQFLYLF